MTDAVLQDGGENRAPVLVADIGGTQVKFGYTIGGQPHAYRRLFPSDVLRNADPVPTLAGMIRAVVADAGLQPRAVVATVPGFVDTDFDRVLFAANVPALNGRSLATELTALLGCPVVLERDAVMALEGEIAAGCARSADHVLGLFFGTGIGAAYSADGVPFRGGGWALEIGHMPFRGEGRALAGMRTDCLEAYCSGRALRDLADQHGAAVEGVFSMQAADALATDLATYVRDQAYAVASAVALFSPWTVVLGGGVLEMEGYPRDRLRDLIAAHAPIAETGRAMDVRWACLGWASALYGAPRVVFRRLKQGEAEPVS